MEKQEVIFDSMKPKKHSVCYKTKQTDPAVTSIYIMRSVLGGGELPKKVKITIEEVKG